MRRGRKDNVRASNRAKPCKPWFAFMPGRLNEGMNTKKKVVVTGASSGIGRATAARFAADGYDVCVNARREERLRELVKSFPPGDHLVCPGDYSVQSVIDEMNQALRARWGRLDALVNCAGVSQSAHAIEAPLEQWRKPFDTMFEGGVRMSRLCVGLMGKAGRIIHITSIHGERAEPG